MDGKKLTFDFYGLYNGVVTFFDRETESVWLQIGGRAVKGEMTGKKLKKGPMLDITWAKWKKLHPDTLVMSPDTPYRRFYGMKGQKPPRGFSRFPQKEFVTSLTHADNRLPRFELVLALAIPQPSAKPEEKPVVLTRAYPVKALKETPGILNDSLGETPVVLFFDAEAETGLAFSRLLDGKTLTFEARKQDDGASAFFDKETGTRWNLEGKAEEGPMAGKTLERLDSHMSEWYGWVSYFPDTTIYGRTDAPQPIDPNAPPPDKPKEEKPNG